MLKLDKKSFFLGVGLIFVLFAMLISRDLIFTKTVQIEILDPETKQVSTYNGNGNILVSLVPPQLTTDWNGMFDVHIFRSIVTGGTFRVPASLYERIVNAWCVEGGCSMRIELSGHPAPNESTPCSFVGYNHDKKQENAIILVCKYY
jgi:hypothetical protein